MNRSTGLLLAGLLLGTPALARAEGSGLVDVEVDCSCADTVGAQVCYKLKETIRASHGYRLIEGGSNYGNIVVEMSCIDAQEGDPGNEAAVAVTFLVYTGKKEKDPELVYLDTLVAVYGAHRTSDGAAGILSQLDRLIDNGATRWRGILENSDKINFVQ